MLSVEAVHERLIVVGFAAPAARFVGAEGAVRSHTVGCVKKLVAVIGCNAGLAGGQASTVESPLNLPSVASTYERIRFKACDNGLAVNVGSLYGPVGTGACVRGSMISNGNGSSGCGVVSHGPLQPPGPSRRSRFPGVPEKLKGVSSALRSSSTNSGGTMPRRPIPSGNKYSPWLAAFPKISMVFRVPVASANLRPVRAIISCGIGVRTPNCSSKVPPAGHGFDAANLGSARR